MYNQNTFSWKKRIRYLKTNFRSPYEPLRILDSPPAFTPFQERSYYFYNYFTLNFISFSLFFWQNEPVKVNKITQFVQYMHKKSKSPIF
jgi:hypothetical protein